MRGHKTQFFFFLMKFIILFIYFFIVLSFVSQLPALDEKKEHHKTRTLKHVSHCTNLNRTKSSRLQNHGD